MTGFSFQADSVSHHFFFWLMDGYTWIRILRDKSMIDWWRFFLFYSFAGSFSEKATRTIRRFSPQLAAKMRPPLAYVSFLLPSSPFLPLAYHPCLFIGLSSVDAHQLREQSISVANPVGSLSWYPHLVCASIYLLFHYATLWNMIWIPFFFLFHSEFCTLVYFMWFVHRLFGTTHWASWYAIYTNFLNLICHILLPCLIPRLLFSSSAICVTATILHATLRTPNLKARLNTFREEFRAVWRNYSEI